jgi:hypothetical protein
MTHPFFLCPRQRPIYSNIAIVLKNTWMSAYNKVWYRSSSLIKTWVDFCRSLVRYSELEKPS